MGERFDVDAFAAHVEEQLVRSTMLGVLDVDWEVEHEDEVDLVTFADKQTTAQAPIAHAPFTEAIADFRQRNVMPKAAFELLSREAKRKAFTVARLAKQDLLDAAHAELLRQLERGGKPTRKDPATGKWIYEGPNLREFRKFAKARLESAGWTPANPSHVETIYRTNIVSAYSTGRHAQMASPAVVQRMPYWQIRGVQDDRQRDTHRHANGIILRADHAFWKKAFPPFGFNCRCRVIARSQAWVDRTGAVIGPIPQGLPDPGFDSGTNAIPKVPASLQATPPAPPPGQAPTPPPPPIATQSGPVNPPGALPVNIPFEGPKLPPAPPPPKPVLPPPLPTKKPAVASAENILAKKISDATGSNPGGVYEGLDGKRRYVKFYDDPAQAQGEHIANQLYGELGLGKVKSTTFLHEGKLAYASELLPGVKTIAEKGLTPERARKALEGFAADVLTANWDAAGLTLDNLVVDKAGKVYRIDNGGALLSRAKAGRKPAEALGNVTEWERFFNHGTNPGYAQLAEAAGVTRAEELGAELAKSIEKIGEVRAKHGGWRAFVDKHGKPLTAMDRERMVGMLEARTDFLEKKLAQLKAPKPVPLKPLVPPPRDITETEIKAAREQFKAKAQAAADFARLHEGHMATVEYTSSSYRHTNDVLRGVRVLSADQEQLVLETRDQINFLLADARKAGHAIDGVVYRGLSLEPAQISPLRAGEQLRWDGFNSATVSDYTAAGFASGNTTATAKPVVFRVRQSQGIPIDKISVNQGESEALLPAGFRSKVIKNHGEVEFAGEKVTLIDLEEML